MYTYIYKQRYTRSLNLCLTESGVSLRKVKELQYTPLLCTSRSEFCRALPNLIYFWPWGVEHRAPLWAYMRVWVWYFYACVIFQCWKWFRSAFTLSRGKFAFEATLRFTCSLRSQLHYSVYFILKLGCLSPPGKSLYFSVNRIFWHMVSAATHAGDMVVLCFVPTKMFAKPVGGSNCSNSSKPYMADSSRHKLVLRNKRSVLQVDNWWFNI